MVNVCSAAVKQVEAIRAPARKLVASMVVNVGRHIRPAEAMPSFVERTCDVSAKMEDGRQFPAPNDPG